MHCFVGRGQARAGAGKRGRPRVAMANWHLAGESGKLGPRAPCPGVAESTLEPDR